MSFSRREFMKVAALGAMSAAAGTGLSACADGSGAGSGTGGDNAGRTDVVVSMSAESEPSAGFDPFYAWGCGEHVHEPLIQSTLVATDTQLNFVKDLATDYACSDDGLLWTFDLREDAFFTDGQRLTARDAAFTLNGIKNFAGAQLDLSYLDEAVATSDTRLELRLNKPFNALLYTLAVVGIVPEHAYDAASYGQNPIGSGRYKLERWDKGQQAVLVANPDYYGAAPKMQRVTVLFMGEEASLAAAQSGSVDIAYTAPDFAASCPSGFELLRCSTVDSRGISLPCIASGATRESGGVEYAAGNDATCHLELRRAINLALDRERLVQNTLNGYGTVAWSVCDGLAWASEGMKVDTDVDAATRLLADAGWAKGGDGVWALGGQRAAFTLMYPASDSSRQAMANEFANQMREFGVEIQVSGSSWSTDAAGLYAHQYSDPIVWGWGANSPVQLYDLTYGKSEGNYACYEDAAVDAHLDAALAKPEVADSFEEWKLAQWDGSTGPAPQGGASWVWLANVEHLYFKRGGLDVAEQKPHPHGHGWSLVNNVDMWSW